MVAAALAGAARHLQTSSRRLALGKIDFSAALQSKQAAEKRNEKASKYLETRDKAKVTVGGSGYTPTPPLARDSVSSAADRAALGGSASERSIQQWLGQGGDQQLQGKGLPLPEKDGSLDAGTQALNRAMSHAGMKPASITKLEELRLAEARVVKALQHALRKGQSTPLELAEAAELPRLACMRLLQSYNSAVLLDKEMFAGTWPLEQRKLRSLDEEIALAQTAS